MKLNGSAVLHAAPGAVFAALNDPEVLAGTIPGCDVLSPLGGDRYAMTVTAGVASIKGSYHGEVALTDQQPPGSFTLRAKGSGTPGTVDTTVQVTLADVGDGTTRLDYAADAAVGGMVGGVGQRMLGSVATKMAGQFFAGVDDVLTGRRPAVAPDTQPAPHLELATGPGREPVPGQVVTAPPLVAFLAGAVVALVGAAVGARLARPGRRG